jgi:hypothetical protein
MLNSRSFITRFLSLPRRAFCSGIKLDSSDSHTDFFVRKHAPETDTHLLDAIRDTVDTNELVIFMKGTADLPMCGFSQ